MDFSFNPKEDDVRVRLTEIGKERYADALVRLEYFNPRGPIPSLAVPDAQGYYVMPMWVFMRSFGGHDLLGPEWLEHYILDRAYIPIPCQPVTAVIYPR